MSLTVASQLGSFFDDELRRRQPDLQLLPLERGAPPPIPDGVEVLFTAPIRIPGYRIPPRAPDGWPFDLKWVQLASAGIDEYPPWLFDGPLVTAARDVSGASLAEFAIAAIFAGAKRLPEVWIDAAEAWQPQPLATVAGSALGLAGFGARWRRRRWRSACACWRCAVRRRRSRCPASKRPTISARCSSSPIIWCSACR
jgi:hypothetical protein